MSLRFILLFTLLLSLTTFINGQNGFINGNPAIAYWEVGSGSEIVVVLHGGPAAAHDYLKPEWDALSKSAKVIYYDQRGCGKSEKAECYSWREHVADLKRVITERAKGQKVILAGSSWGATLALLYAYSFSKDVKGLILSGTYNWIGKGEAAKDCAAYLPTTSFAQHPRDTFRYISLNYVAGEASEKEKRIESHTIAHSMTVNSMIDAPVLSQLKTITPPVLLFKGRGRCPEIPIKEGSDLYKAILPNVEVYSILNACHDPWLSHTEEFFTRCNEFIKELR